MEKHNFIVRVFTESGTVIQVTASKDMVSAAIPSTFRSIKEGTNLFKQCIVNFPSYSALPWDFVSNKSV